MKFQVDCNKWFRGRGSEASELLREDGNMCCLGFLSLACGLSEDDILGVGGPGAIYSKKVSELYNISTVFKELVFPSGLNTEACFALMGANDNEFISDKRRMEKLTLMFQDIGVEVEFINVPKDQC